MDVQLLAQARVVGRQQLAPRRITDQLEPRRGVIDSRQAPNRNPSSVDGSNGHLTSAKWSPRTRRPAGCGSWTFVLTFSELCLTHTVQFNPDGRFGGREGPGAQPE